MLTYAIRHAESLANAHPGTDLNSGLSGLGQRQADTLADRLAACNLAAIYSSPYERCLATARPIADRHGLPILVKADCCEFHYQAPASVDDLRLVRPGEVASTYSFAMLDPDVSHLDCEWPPIHETPAELSRRMRRMADQLKTRWSSPDDIVVVVSHGSPIARMIDAWLDDDPGRSFRYIVDNAAVNALRFDRGVSSLVCLNERSHLVDLPAPAASNWDSAGCVKPRTSSTYW